MKTFKGVMLIVMAIALAACGNSAGNDTPEKVIEGASVVLMANEQEILADATMWTITNKTKFRASIGKVISAEDMKPGDLINCTSEGDIMESYPSQGTLQTVTVLNDEYSLNISAAISSFLEDQSEGELVEFNIQSIKEDTLTADMKLWDLEDDRTFIVEIDIKTNDYNLTDSSGASS